MSLRSKLFLAIISTMLLTTVIVTMFLVYRTLNQIRDYQAELQVSGQQSVDAWANVAMPDHLPDAEYVRRLATYAAQTEGVAADDRLFQSVMLIDSDRLVRAIVGQERPGLRVGDAVYDRALLTAIQDRATQSMEADGRQVIYRPIIRHTMAIGDVPARTDVVFVLRVVPTLRLPNPARPADLMWPVLSIMGTGTLLLMAIVYVLLSRMVLRPLEQLVGVSRSVAAGNYEQSVEAPPDAEDEIGQLIRTFDQMMREVRDHRLQLEDRVDDAVKQHRKAEQALIIAQRLAATGTLAAGIAHEINNPLQGMQNAVRRLRKRLGESVEARDRDYLDLIDEGLARVQSIVKQVLDVSRRHVNPQPFDMAEPVDRAVALVEHKAQRSESEIVVEAPQEPTPRCFGDRGEINQVLTNLLINGLDAIRDARIADQEAGRDPRSGRVTIHWEATEEGITTSVRDNGIGMAESDVTRAFDAFYTTKQDGTGLGLSIIHNIIDSHGGTIRLDSERGIGTTVTFTIPAELTD